VVCETGGKSLDFDCPDVGLFDDHLALVELGDSLFELLRDEHVMALDHVTFEAEVDAGIHLLSNVLIDVLGRLGDDIKSELVFSPSFGGLSELPDEIARARSEIGWCGEVLVCFVQREEHRRSFDMGKLDIAADFIRDNVGEQTRYH